MKKTIIEKNAQAAKKPPNRILPGSVGKWHTTLKTLCIATFFFSVFSLLFASLTLYSSDGNVIERTLDFDSMTFLLTPCIASLLFLIFGSSTHFSTMRVNSQKNYQGKWVKQTENGGKIIKRVFDNKWVAITVTIVLYLCYITSFSLFFAYGTPRCATESLNNNTEFIYLLHKIACSIYNIGFMKMLLSLLILIQTGMLAFYLYKSMPIDDQETFKKTVGEKTASVGEKTKGLLGKLYQKTHEQV